MLNTNTLIRKFAASGIGCLIITDPERNIVYQNGKPYVDQAHWTKWSTGTPAEMTEDQVVEWEIAEKDTGIYYRIHSAKITDEGKLWLVHHIYDISDFAKLSQDLSRYSRDWKNLSACQQEMISALSDDCRAILPIAVKYLKTDLAKLFIKRRDALETYTLKKNETCINATKSFSVHTDCHYKAGEIYPLPDTDGEFLCCAGGDTVSGETYAVLVKTGDNMLDNMQYPLYFNVFKLFIENTLLREKVTFESEHDHLTGLYNKGKYLEMLKNDFPFYDSIAIFNMDVNYLKRTNDTLGHEAGNRLLTKAADSLKAISNENIFPFRLGGDEFMLVASNVDEDRVQKIKSDWEKKLNELNTTDPEIECVIACGLVFGKKPYDLGDILGRADILMYQNKRAIKISRGEDPNSR
jgi:diguanylate cyclase (GGDEF)-like protein